MKTSLLMLGGLALATGCATGLGTGEMELAGLPLEPVSFEYQAKSPDSGQLSAVTDDGERFQGNFEELGGPTARERLAPAIEANRDWTGYVVEVEPATPGGPADVVASLKGDRGHFMQCRVELDDAVRGLAGGGHGECLVSDGHDIDVKFPRRS